MNRRFSIAALAVILNLLACESGDTTTNAQCPNTGLGETTLDCPWAQLARDMSIAAANNASVKDVLRHEEPAIAAAIDADARSPYLALWGRAINFDQLAQGVIVDPPAVDALNTWMGAPARQDRITHAGVQHTYGYLFSDLKTSFGYKRARWVGPDVSAGFGLPPGTFGPLPPSGTLFSNATFFAGHIAFAGEPESSALAANPNVSTALSAFDFSSLTRVRLSETIQVPGPSRTVVLRSDFVPFVAPTGSQNTHWLIYSISDSAVLASKLITAFPITKSSFSSYTSASLLGDKGNIATQYNAYVDGVSGQSFAGHRELSTPGPFAQRGAAP